MIASSIVSSQVLGLLRTVQCSLSHQVGTALQNYSSSTSIFNALSGKRAVDSSAGGKKPKSPLFKGAVSPSLTVPDHILKPSYVAAKSKPPWGPGELLDCPETLAKMQLACELAAKVLDYAETLIAPGVTTDQIDKKLHQYTIDLGAYPSALGYAGFPKSVCTSVNECVCHGIPDSRPLEEGDIINVDMVVFKDGYHGDNSRTFRVGKVTQAASDLIEVTREAMEAGIKLCAPGVPFTAIGSAIQAVADKHRMGVVRDFIGHGVGRQLHCEPKVFHYRNYRTISRMAPGQTFTIEPQLTLGRSDVVTWRDGWTVVTADGSLSAQFEHVVLVTEGGCEVLTVNPDGKGATGGS